MTLLPGHDRLEARFLEILHARTGIRLPPEKLSMLETRLGRRIRQNGHSTLRDYLHFVFEEGGYASEWPEIVDKVTTHKTDFFREPAHYDFLSGHIIPELLSRVRAPRPVRFRLWSAAASTGAEAWSAAMVLQDLCETHGRLDWTILGTDISEPVIATANRGIYPFAEVRPVPRIFQDRYIMSARARNGKHLARVVPELRSRVRFATMNLTDMPYKLDKRVDVIMLRNVLIYFEPAMQAAICNSVQTHLAPGGHLMVGHSESMVVRHEALDQVAPSIFRKKGAR